MSKIALSGPAGGTATYTVTAPTGATDRVITLPDNTGTLISTASTFAGTGPAFSAWASGTTTVANVTNTKVLFATEEFDTNSNFASSTFTPTVAGYYQINANVYIQGGATGAGEILIYKNGFLYKAGPFATVITGIGVVTGISAIVYCNGTTDYIDVYAYQNTGASSTVQAVQAYTWFQGALLRAA